MKVDKREKIKRELMEEKDNSNIIDLCLEVSSSSVNERKLKWREKWGVMGLHMPPGGSIVHTNMCQCRALVR